MGEAPDDRPAAAAVEVENLKKRYGGVKAVEAVSFRIREGEIFGLLGPNGAGKTTTLEILEGIRRPDAGRVVVAGVDVCKHPRAVRGMIGVQLQEAALFDRLTVRETLYTFGAFHARSISVTQLMERFALQEKAGTFVEDLSGGQRQRLSIALAMQNDPQLVFLDEPTTGLDPQARHNLWEVIASIREEGRTVVLTTHYMEEAQHLCDRVAIMDHGRIVAEGEPRRLIAAHAGTVKVSFTAPSADGLEALPGVERVQTQGDRVTLHCDDPQRALVQLVQSEHLENGLWEGMRLEGGTLEDVFLNLTGRQLRE